MKGKVKIKVAKEDKDDEIDGMDSFEEMALYIYLSVFIHLSVFTYLSVSIIYLFIYEGQSKDQSSKGG